MASKALFIFMTKRTLLVSFLSFIIVSIPIYFFGYRKDEVDLNPDFFVESLIRYYAYTTIPLIGGVFLVLLTYNWFIKKQLLNKTIEQKNRDYIRYSFFIFLLIMAVFMSIYYAENRGSFSQFLVQHTGYIALLVVAFFLNRKLVWRNFK